MTGKKPSRFARQHFRRPERIFCSILIRRMAGHRRALYRLMLRHDGEAADAMRACRPRYHFI